MKLFGAIGVAAVVAANNFEQDLYQVVSTDLETDCTVDSSKLAVDVNSFGLALNEGGTEAVLQSFELVKHDLFGCQLQKGDGFIGSIVQYLKENFLKFDEQIIEEFAEMGKVCTFRKPDGKRCGQLLVQIVKHILIGDHHGALRSQGASSFLGGLMRGLFGNSKNYQRCAANVQVMVHEAGAMMNHLKGRKWGAVVDDLMAIFGMVLDSLRRRQADLALEFPIPHPSRPHWVPRHTHKCGLVEEASGQRQIVVPGCTGTGCKANGMDMDCAWCVYDLDKCVASYSTTCHETVAARQAQNAACEGADSTTTVMPDDPDSTTAMPDPNSTSTMMPDTNSTTTMPGDEPRQDETTTGAPGASRRRAAPAPAPDASRRRSSPDSSSRRRSNPAPQPSPAPHHGDVESGACRDAIGDLTVFLGIFKGVRGPMGVLDNLKDNFLEADAEILDYMGELGKYCTFRQANAGKCGYRIGAIARDIMVGLEKSAVVV